MSFDTKLLTTIQRLPTHYNVTLPTGQAVTVTNYGTLLISLELIFQHVFWYRISIQFAFCELVVQEA